MKRYRFKKIDAFATEKSSGNPAGCIYLENENALNPDQMLSIASEMKGYVSEVAYLTDNGGIKLKYYSSEREVAFCGHATIAVIYDYFKENPELLIKNEIQIQVGAQSLTVYNEIEAHDAIFITAPNPKWFPREWDTKKLAQAMGTTQEAFSNKYPIRLINAGLDSLIIPMASLDTALALKPDLDILKAYCIEQDIDILVVFSTDVAFSQNAFRTRVFPPRFGYLEDPATGSGNSAFGYYLLEQGLWDGSLISLEQNGSRQNPNQVKLKTILKDDTQQVLFGGGAQVRIDGEYLVYFE